MPLVTWDWLVGGFFLVKVDSLALTEIFAPISDPPPFSISETNFNDTWALRGQGQTS